MMSSNISADINEYLNYVKESSLKDPKEKQIDYIARQSRFSLLQGPPGTGKSLTLSHALLGKGYSIINNRGFARSLMIAPSNNAVDTTMEKVSEFKSCLENETSITSFRNLQLIRVTTQEVNQIPDSHIEYINYHEDTDRLEELKNILSGQMDFSIVGNDWSSGQSSYFIFATPNGAYKTIKKIFDEGTRPCFDLLAIDESSMMTMPNFLMASASTTSSAQILISGDHRQMPPVQKHNWDYEDRRTIQEILPFLSVMDFFRLLSQYDSFGHEDDFREVQLMEEQDIPIDRLEITYRCHSELADILKELIYKQDNISYRAEEGRDKTIELSSENVTQGIYTITNPDSPVVLILHQERESQQSNPFELAIIKEIIKCISTIEEIGVVTPHNAQRGRLLNELPTDRDIHIDTIERFQGGECDVIVFSATESDPDYIRKASEFIHSPNRLNVAISRMKKKLIILASESLFDFVPTDEDEYENVLFWKKLLREVKRRTDNEPIWKGTVYELLGDNNIDIPNDFLEVFCT